MRNSSTYKKLTLKIKELERIIALSEKEQNRPPFKSMEQHHQSQKMEALGTMVAGVAHEINNPINLIMYNTPLLQKVWRDFLPLLKKEENKNPGVKYGGFTFNFLKDNLEQLLADINMAACRVAKIVADLKAFSKQSYVNDTKPLSVNQAVRNAVRLTKNTVSVTNIDLDLELTEDIPDIHGSLHSVEQIISNIAINAVQAIDHNSGKIKISTGYSSKDGYVVLSITDNGRGINPALSEKLFDPFITDKQAAGGTGLGLSVSYNLVNAHNGKIFFESKKGEKTTFTVLFPTVTKEKPLKILIVDDDREIRSLLKQGLLQRKSYLVDEASNGIEACIKMGSYRPDLLILDIIMPDMAGLEVCRIIKKEPELTNMKIILITGYPGHPELRDIVELGYNNILYKPFDLQEFFRIVDKLLTE